MRHQRTASIVLAGSAHVAAWVFSVLTIRYNREQSQFTVDELGWISETALASPLVFTAIVLVCVVRGRNSGWALTATALTTALAFVTGASAGLFLWPVVFLMGFATLFLVDMPRS